MKLGDIVYLRSGKGSSLRKYKIVRVLETTYLISSLDGRIVLDVPPGRLEVKDEALVDLTSFCTPAK